MPGGVQNSSLRIPHADEPENAAFSTKLRGLLRCFLCANLTNCAVLCAERECVRGLPVSRQSLVGGRAGVAQLVEHLICNQRVGGSNPFASST
jgi:hypothetical protein